MEANFTRVSSAHGFASFDHGRIPRKEWPFISFKTPIIFKLFNIYFTHDRLKFLKILCKIFKLYVYFTYDLSKYFFFCSSGPSKKNLLDPPLDLVRPIGNLIGSGLHYELHLVYISAGHPVYNYWMAFFLGFHSEISLLSSWWTTVFFNLIC